MKISQTLKAWLTKNSLSVYQLLSIAFVPRRTAADIASGDRWLPAMQRLYIATKLDEFRLNEQELVQYAKQKKEHPHVLADELICEHFVKNFVQSGAFPAKEDSLVISEREYKDKKVLTKYLLAKYFSKNSHPTTSTIGGSKTLTPAIDEIDGIFSKTEPEVLSYRNENREALRQLRNLVNILLEDNPKEAYNQVKATEKLFS